jgi:Ser/Thr protein kinase RdoA (MazF antagonist)
LRPRRDDPRVTDPVRRLVEREFGTAPEFVASVEEGLQHDTYFLGVDGREYVLQFAAEGDDRADALERGLYWYVEFADTPVPVPEVVTERVRSFEGRRYSLVRRVPGATARLDVTPGRVRNAARHLAAIHDARTFEGSGWVEFEEGTPSVAPFQAGDLASRLSRNLPRHCRTLREYDIRAGADAVEELLGTASDEFPTSFDPVLCHDDFSPDNVVFEGTEVAAILDFDRCYAGHHQRDLAQAANAFWMHDPGADWEIRETFYEGYRERRDRGSDLGANEPLYRVETLARTIAGMCETPGLSGSEREFYDGRIVEAVERADRP